GACERVHAMRRVVLKGTRLTKIEDPEPAGPVAASSPPPPPQPSPRVTDGVRATAISEQRWVLVDRSGVATLARRHPLTVEGEEIGSFDLVVACVPGGDAYDG